MAQLAKSQNEALTKRMAQMEEEQAKLQCQLEQLEQEKNILQKLVNEYEGKMEKIQGPLHEKEKQELLNGIRGILNKITSSTFEELANDFCAFKIHDYPKLLAPITDLIFDKAVEEPQYCPLYSDLCKKQVDVERQLQRQKQRDKPADEQQVKQQGLKLKEKSFRNAIVFKCQNTFLASKDYDKKMKRLQEKLKVLDESDGKGRTQIEDELEMRCLKEKRRLLGIINFIGQIYRHELLVESVIDWCAIELIKRFQATADEVYIEYAVGLVKTVGKIYEQRKEQALQTYACRRAAGQLFFCAEPKQEYLLDMVFSHLSQLKPNVSNRVKFAIMDMEDLRKNNWIESDKDLPKQTTIAEYAHLIGLRNPNNLRGNYNREKLFELINHGNDIVENFYYIQRNQNVNDVDLLQHIVDLLVTTDNPEKMIGKVIIECPGSVYSGRYDCFNWPKNAELQLKQMDSNVTIRFNQAFGNPEKFDGHCMAEYGLTNKNGCMFNVQIYYWKEGDFNKRVDKFVYYKEKSSGRAGWSSAVRRHAEAASFLFLRESSETESGITGLSRFNDLDNMTTIGRKAWLSHRDRTSQRDGAGGSSSGAENEGGW